MPLQRTWRTRRTAHGPSFFATRRSPTLLISKASSADCGQSKSQRLWSATPSRRRCPTTCFAATSRPMLPVRRKHVGAATGGPSRSPRCQRPCFPAQPEVRWLSRDCKKAQPAMGRSSCCTADAGRRSAPGQPCQQALLRSANCSWLPTCRRTRVPPRRNQVHHLGSGARRSPGAADHAPDKNRHCPRLRRWDLSAATGLGRRPLPVTAPSEAAARQLGSPSTGTWRPRPCSRRTR